MSFLEALLLGIVQGLTEFLPISSTAHLRIVPALCGWEDPGAPFTAVTQIGTMAAVLVYFRRELTRMGIALLKSIRHMKPFETADSSMAWWILFGTAPIVLFGLLFKELIETSFRSLYVISASLIGLAALLAVAERVTKGTRDVPGARFRDAIVVGLAQAVALIPGSSRSGVTITAGLFLNFNRQAAATFSFLLSVPAIALSGFYQLWEMRHGLGGEAGAALLTATLVSGVTGFVAIAALLRFLRTHSTWIFIWYRIALGLLLLALLRSGHLVP